ncbi:alginate lyase family protein [Pontiellaceae bacterium B1224]|nr:alginate lyase family protein [Pontiellaceae bacterium B1224]
MNYSGLKQAAVLMGLCAVMGTAVAERAFVHPGISHKQSDLERMRLQVEAGKEPWLATYQLMQKSGKASYDYKVQGKPGQTSMKGHGAFINDGFAAYYNALMWNITGDERHAEKCVEIFNAWSDLKRIEDQFPLNNGRGPWKMLEGAEIIRSTYDGWSQEDIEKFQAMLVYPGWSGTEVPEEAIRNKDCTFYWNIYQGDPARHGNQGLFAYRSLMAMGIFCDNEIMYDRALRYLKGLPHRPDDVPYPSGPPILSDRMNSSNEYYDEYRQMRRDDRIEDYGYNEVMEHYIYENGQCQESARDQAHALGGVSIISAMCEMAWNQGDDLYGHLDNRVLKGLEFYFRYNLSLEHTYPDQPEPWEPTLESGEFIKRSDRTGRWTSLKINPWVGNNLERQSRGLHNYNGIYEMNLGHYKDRLGLPATETKWLERGFQVMTDKLGVEDDAHAVDHPGWGGIKFRRVSPGDPVQGFDADGLPIFGINRIPCAIEAENYDFFPISGNGRTYYDTTEGNRNKTYRNDDVDIVQLPDGGYALSELMASEWLTYTVHVPKSGNYDLSVRYMAREAGQILFGFQGKAATEAVTLPATTEWKTYSVARQIPLEQGVQQMKLAVAGPDAAYILDQLMIEQTMVEAEGPGVTDAEKMEPVKDAVDERSPVPEVVLTDVAVEDGAEKNDASRNQTMLLGGGVILIIVITGVQKQLRRRKK